MFEMEDELEPEDEVRVILGIDLSLYNQNLYDGVEIKTVKGKNSIVINDSTFKIIRYNLSCILNSHFHLGIKEIRLDGATIPPVYMLVVAYIMRYWNLPIIYVDEMYTVDVSSFD